MPTLNNYIGCLPLEMSIVRWVPACHSPSKEFAVIIFHATKSSFVLLNKFKVAVSIAKISGSEAANALELAPMFAD